LGWKAVGPIIEYHRKPHQLMEADLEDNLISKLKLDCGNIQ
jgi:hypothetical protein